MFKTNGPNKLFEKQREYQDRARQRLLAKVNSEEYKAKQRAKQVAAQLKQREKIKVRGYKPLSTKPRRPIKSQGMAGKARSSKEMALHDQMAQLGCICCINKGLIQAFSGSPVSIHHINGRTKEDSHKQALPLCGWHHDTPIAKSDPVYQKHLDVFPLHAKGSDGGRKAWEEVNGTQGELLRQVMDLIS